MQTILNLERVIQVRIVDQAFPADGGTRLLEIHTHDQIQGIGNFLGQYLETIGVFVGGLDVVDRARADHDKQTVVGAIENVANDFAALGDGAQGGVAQGISRLS